MNESFLKINTLSGVTIGCQPGAQLRLPRYALSLISSVPILNRWLELSSFQQLKRRLCSELQYYHDDGNSIGKAGQRLAGTKD